MNSIDRLELGRRELTDRIAGMVVQDGTIEPADGIELRRASSPRELGHGVSYPALCIIAQGSKEMLLGDHRYHYDPAHYLIATAALPMLARITGASEDRPYLGFLIRLEPALVSSVLLDAGHLESRGNSAVKAIDVSPLEENLMDAVVRLVRLLDTPEEARYLMPLVQREIVFRLIRGEQGGRLHHVAAIGGNTQGIIKAVARIREEFDQPLRIETVANDIGMSVSGFHSHFKAVTGMSPLQFQKQLRLQEARRLMLGEGFNAGAAGVSVGYGDISQFNREYKRLFGEPPVRDVKRLQRAEAQPSPI